MATPFTPWRQALLDPVTGLLTRYWQQWFQDRLNVEAVTAQRLGQTTLTTQAAAIAATAISAPALTAGLYRIAYLCRVTRVATTSSSFTVTLGWTSNGVAQSRIGTVSAGNFLTTWDNWIGLIRLDAGSTVTFQVAYASVGGTSMQYGLDCSLELVLTP